MSHKTIKTIVLAGILTAIGIIIPIFSPIKIYIEPMSFTLASHVAIFVAMFVSPTVAISVTLGTTLGFLINGSPLLIVLRALSHLLFAITGSLIIKQNPKLLDSPVKAMGLNAFLAVIHALGEVLVITPFFIGGSGLLKASYFSDGYLYSVILILGVGTIVHSIIDYILAYVIWQPLRRTFGPTPLQAPTVNNSTTIPAENTK